MRFDEVATCPFCADELTLASLPIVATNFTRDLDKQGSGAELGGDNPFGNLVEDDQPQDASSSSSEHGPAPIEEAASLRPVSGAKVLSMRGSWPVVAMPPPPPAEEPRRGILRRKPEPPDAPTVGELAHPADLPARLCTSCETPLPVDIGERRLFTIAIVGANGSAKTHFLASMLHEAYHEQALSDAFGCREFLPDEETGERYHNSYHVPLYGDRVTLEATQAHEDVRFNPLKFRVRFDEYPKPVTLLFHDVAGEVLRDRKARARAAPFVRRADAIIFLVDPRWFAPVGEYLKKKHGIPYEMAPFNQADLFNAVADEMTTRNLDEVPVSVAVSKSDLVSSALGRDFTFDLEAAVTDREGWIQQIKDIDEEVESLLTNEFRARDLIAALSRFPNKTLHAVAPIGSQPQQADHRAQQAIEDLRPRRCLDPLLSALRGLMDI